MRGEGPSNSRSLTYDAHARIDTSAVAMTEVKGCILIKMLTEFSLKRGALPSTLDEVLQADSIRPVQPPTSEWKSDGWRRVFEYEVSSNGTLRLVSRGPDGTANTKDDVSFVPE
jgi:hypothetical protein